MGAKESRGLGARVPGCQGGEWKGTHLLSVMRIEYCGEWYDVFAGEILTIGSAADLVIDDNPELDPRLLQVFHEFGVWWIANTASARVVQVSDPSGRVSTELGPGSRVPVVFQPAHVVFAAGRTTYEFALHGDVPYSTTATFAEFRPARIELPRLTAAQRLLVVVLCEPALRHPSRSSPDYPTSSEAAARLGWSLTAFNRKLDNVCDRLDRAGVAGLRGGRGNLATRRRARLVEYALSVGLVTVDDLDLLPESEAEAVPA
jgi:hypothetical protein